jgi:hypothetical protein
MIAALVRPGDPGQRQAVIKLDAWATRDLGLIRRVLPDTPWVFLYRDPVEVVASQLRLPGLPALPGGLPPELFGLDLAGALALGRAGYCAHVFAMVCEDALTHLDDAGLLVGYDELPGAVWERILGHFGMAEVPGARAHMLAVADRSAKQPQLRFDSGGAAPALDHETRSQVERLAAPAYRRVRARAREDAIARAEART